MTLQIFWPKQVIRGREAEGRDEWEGGGEGGSRAKPGNQLVYLYGLNTELIDGSSKFDFQTWKIICQFFVRVLVIRCDATTMRRNFFN